MWILLPKRLHQIGKNNSSFALSLFFWIKGKNTIPYGGRVLWENLGFPSFLYSYILIFIETLSLGKRSGMRVALHMLVEALYSSFLVYFIAF